MDFKEKYILLRSHFCFKDLAKSDAAVIADAAVFREFKKGQCIVTKDSLATHLFIILKGAVDCGAKKYTLMFLPQAALDGDDYAADFFADSQTGAQCLVLTRERFAAAVKNCPSILLSYTQFLMGQNDGC